MFSDDNVLLLSNIRVIVHVFGRYLYIWYTSQFWDNFLLQHFFSNKDLKAENEFFVESVKNHIFETDYS